MRRAYAYDIESIINAWPSDLPADHEGDSSRLKEVLQARFAQGIPCFIATQQGFVLAALWCDEWRLDDALPTEIRGRPSFEFRNIFTVDKARGHNLAPQLMALAREQMATEGKPHGFSVVPQHYIASIAMHNKIGGNQIVAMRLHRAMGLILSRTMPCQ